MKDWRGIPLNVGDQVIWAVRRWDGDRRPQVGRVTRVNEANDTVTVKRTEPEPRGKYESGSANLPSHRVTVVDVLPHPSEVKGFMVV